MPQIMLNYRTDGRRRVGIHFKRLLDEAEQICQDLTGDGWWRCWWKTGTYDLS